MASQLTIVLWTDHTADPSLAQDLAQQAAAQIFRSSSQQAAVVSATSTPLESHDIAAAVDAFATRVEPTPPVPDAPVVTLEPQPTYPDGTAIPTPDVQATNSTGAPVPTPEPVVVTPDPAVAEGTTAASAGIVPVPDPATPLVDSDEHMAVLVQLFEALTPEQKAELDAEVQTMEDAHDALARIYAPIVAAKAIDLEARPTDHDAPPAS